MSEPYTVTTQPGGYPPQAPGGYPPQAPGGYPPQASGGYPPQAPGGYPPQAPGGYPPSGDGYMGPGAPGQPGFAQPMYPHPGMYGATGQPIAMQPVPGGPGVNPAGWMPAPAVPANCPRGLEYLSQVDQLLVKQKVEVLEAFTGFETNNKYEVLNSMGQKVYHAVEDTCCASRNFCGSVRPFDIKIFDNQRQEVMHLDRPLRCSHCLCFCCLQKMEVQAPPGTPIGYVRQAWSLCWPKYKLNNEQDETMLLIKGPCCRIDICGDIEFEITSPDESTRVGKITKQWSGMAKEVFTDADNFGVSFPVDLDVKAKATALGAVFLIDFMYFEDGGSKNDH